MYNMQHQPNTSLQTSEERQMGLFMHLSQFANVIFFPLGIILPIILWQTQKDKMPALDVHGKMIVNFMISMTIYVFISIVLVFVLVGILLLPILGLIGIIFPIVGAVKANNGEFWEYPLTIKFIK